MLSDRRFAIGAVGVIAVLVAWEMAPRLDLVPSALVPPFSVAMATLPRLIVSGTFWSSVGTSAQVWAVGFAGGSLLGVVLGVLMARSRIAWRLIDPFLVMVYPIPKAALVLFLMIWFGSITFPTIIVVATTALLPVVMSTYHAAQGIDEKLVWSARSLGTPRATVLFRIIVPGSVAGIISGAQIGIGISLFTLLGAELIIRQEGVGATMFSAWDNGLFDLVWGIAFFIATAGFLLDLIYRRTVAVMVPWVDRLD